MTKRLTEPEINMVQGTVSKSVFMRHYFNKDYIPDFYTAVEEETHDIYQKLCEKVGLRLIEPLRGWDTLELLMEYSKIDLP